MVSSSQALTAALPLWLPHDEAYELFKGRLERPKRNPRTLTAGAGNPWKARQVWNLPEGRPSSKIQGFLCVYQRGDMFYEVIHILHPWETEHEAGLGMEKLSLSILWGGGLGCC